MMKKMIAFLAPAVLLASPAFAGEEGVLKASLADATRQEMSVAPWVGISVQEVVRGDKLVWVADTSGGQRYACFAPASADAVLARQVSCARLGAVAVRLASRHVPSNANSVRSQLPYPGQFTDITYAPRIEPRW